MLAAMFYHHLKFFIRKVRKDIFSYSIGYLGLIIGLSVLSLLGIYTHQQFNHGKYTPDHERIYRANSLLDRQGTLIEFALSFGFLVDKLVSDFPEVESATRMMTIQSQSVFRVGERILSMTEGHGFYVDESFFEVFNLPLVYGSNSGILDSPDAIILTASFAKQLFGEENPLGQVVEDVWDEGADQLIVKGVIDDLPINAHFQFDYLISGRALGYWDSMTRPNVGSSNYVYYKTSASIDPEDLDQRIISSLSTFQKKPTLIKSIPLADIHFATPVLFEHTSTADKEQITLIGFAGILLFLASLINFLVIHLSQLIDRSKEFGIKKAMGISSGQWVGQLLVESFMSVFVIAGASVVLSYFLHRLFFVDMIGQDIFSILQLNHIQVFTSVVLIILLSILLFSALKLHAQFGSVLSKQSTIGFAQHKGLLSDRVMLFIQYAFVMLSIIGSYFVWKQLAYMQSLPMGYQTEWKINTTRPQDATHTTWNKFKQALSQSPRVIKSGSSLEKWLGSDYNSTPIRVLTGDAADTIYIQVHYNYIDDQLIPTLGLELVEGRNFDRKFASDTFNILLNETAAKAFGHGTIIGNNFESRVFRERSGKVIGIVKDFHFQSMDKEIPPVALMFHHPGYYKENMVIQLSHANITQALDDVEAAWNESGIISPFEYTFLDQFQAKLFEREAQSAQFMGVTASCSILVALIGLIGLVSFQNKRRSKELSLRKVFGASVSDLLMMINKTYTLLIGVSIILSIPIAYLAVSQWLDDYAYRITPTVWDFMLVAAGVLMVSLVTVSLQSWQTATSNPTDVLRSE